MSDQPFIGRVYLEVGSGASPEDYVRMCEIDGISGLGETNEQEDVTTFCSGGFREFIGGLADGSEITIDGNYIRESAMRRRLIRAVKDKEVLNLRVVVDDDNDNVMEESYYFAAAALSWQFNPSVDSKNRVQFGIKVSGEIDIQEPG